MTVDPATENARTADGLPLIQYWHEDEPPDYIAELFAGFSHVNPTMRHMVFSEATAEDFIAEHFSDREVMAFRACAVPSMQSDYVRFCAGLTLGGFYADADFRCHGGIRELIPLAGRGQLFRGPRGNIVSGIFAFGSAGHAFLELALEIVTANIERRFTDEVNFATGPPIVEGLVRLGQAGHGPFDAMVDRLRSGSGRNKILMQYIDVIGDYSRVVRALEGIEVDEHKGYPPCVQV